MELRLTKLLRFPRVECDGESREVFAWVVTREYGCLVFFPHGLGREKGMFSAKTLDYLFFFPSCNFQFPCFSTIERCPRGNNAFFEIKFTKLNIYSNV